MKWKCPECGFTLESPETDDPYYCRGEGWTIDNPYPHGELVEMKEVR